MSASCVAALRETGNSTRALRRRSAAVAKPSRSIAEILEEFRTTEALKSRPMQPRGSAKYQLRITRMEKVVTVRTPNHLIIRAPRL